MRSIPMKPLFVAIGVCRYCWRIGAALLGGWGMPAVDSIRCQQLFHLPLPENPPVIRVQRLWLLGVAFVAVSCQPITIEEGEEAGGGRLLNPSDLSASAASTLSDSLAVLGSSPETDEQSVAADSASDSRTGYTIGSGH